MELQRLINFEAFVQLWIFIENNAVAYLGIQELKPRDNLSWCTN